MTLGPEETYGLPDNDLQHTVARKTFGDTMDPKPGMVMGMSVSKNGRQHKIPALVTEVTGDDVCLDFNHPLAGKTLTYTLTLKAIKK